MIGLRHLTPMLLLLPLAAHAQGTAGSPWSLTHDERRAFLRHYAPVIFKRAEEDNRSHQGHDWLTNFFYDGDTDLSNNKRNWSREKDDWIRGQNSNWQMRPTVYTALIEFMEGPEKSLILLYHVYHAKQKGKIHDWERIELRLDGVGVQPGMNERLRYAVITEHKQHNAPSSYTSDDINFHDTPQGHHIMIWQAEGSGWFSGFRGAELHYVEDSARRQLSRMRRGRYATTDINGAGDKAFHYVFVPEDDTDLVAQYQAERLTQSNAARLSAGTSLTVGWRQVKRITYELQDVADIWRTHLDPRSWRQTDSFVLSTPVLAEDGTVEIPSSSVSAPTIFLPKALDDQDKDEDRNGYPRKSWMWGEYFFERGVKPLVGSWTGNSNGGRNDLRFQHDYFAHNGVESQNTYQDEQLLSGRWLLDATGWHEPAQGGFDGRWVQLFAD